MKPRLTIGPLTGRIYVTTRYRELPGGIIEAITKHDVTSDFMAVKEVAERDFDYTPVTSPAPAEPATGGAQTATSLPGVSAPVPTLEVPVEPPERKT